LVFSPLLLANTNASVTEESSRGFAIVGAHITGIGKATLIVRNGRIAAIDSDTPDKTMRVVSATGLFIAPTFIDSHVHLAYAYSANELARGGIAGAVDLAAPMSFLAADLKPMTVIRAGPMITAVAGYPTKSWGADGYGLEISGVTAAQEAVDRLYAAGARVIKIPVGDATGGGILSMAKNGSILSDAEIKAIVDRAHSHGMRVASHALNDFDALRAAAAGVDVLAHTPVERLSDQTIKAWSGRALISTLAAFPDSTEAVGNVRRLREAGTTVLYGTDMGYTSFPGINPQELELLQKAGLDNAAIIEAGTTVPAEYWGFRDGLGTLAVGNTASFLILDADPGSDPLTLSRPLAVYIYGRLIPTKAAH
tara:strand:- start:1368 stop:2468 length:1101 start_codon:yes stop_codon:yes gene_type:complete